MVARVLICGALGGGLCVVCFEVLSCACCWFWFSWLFTVMFALGSFGSGVVGCLGWLWCSG